MEKGSSSNIIFMLVFDQLRINRALLDKRMPPIYAFEGTQVQPLGNIHITLTIGECPNQATTVTNFVIVDCSTTYNVVLGQPTFTELDVTISYRTLMLKFTNAHGI
ncbi:hypothetical protein PRUPE_6G166600 [Prunus persica]|uniref:Uncharacterized protein n=1 Tax=Prunus persica TaxID=3760 RepID=A0A251NRG3_PRUPE|nr:hypothetical protein PRUPE_6G166600 [Prunus persica]